MMQEDIRNIFLAKYAKAGNEQFFNFLVEYATTRVDNVHEIKGATPELELMNYYDQFLEMYREDGEPIYLEMAKVFRRAGHKIYLLMVKREMIRKSEKFLNIVD
jgi:hypothetical protein